jgi:hypothetical protein
MRKLYFLLPGTDKKFACGGLWAELKTFKLAEEICEAAIVTYRQREPQTLFLTDVLQQQDLERCIFIVSWGFHVPQLVRQLMGQFSFCHVVYHAHSSGYGFSLPAQVPILTVSRNTMGYWGQKAPASLIYYLPNHIADEFRDHYQPRDIDILVQTRKSSQYLLQQLIPHLQQDCRVHVLDGYVEDLIGLFNRSKIYLYDSAEYWAQQNVTEGFGLPPMEALACGCQVFSSLNNALADYLDPGFNCHKIAGYSTAYDRQRIFHVLQSPQQNPLTEDFFAEYRTANIQNRLALILQELNQFFDHQNQYPSDIPELTRWRLSQLWFKRAPGKVMGKLNRMIKSK